MPVSVILPTLDVAEKSSAASADVTEISPLAESAISSPAVRLLPVMLAPRTARLVCELMVSINTAAPESMMMLLRLAAASSPSPSPVVVRLFAVMLPAVDSTISSFDIAAPSVIAPLVERITTSASPMPSSGPVPRAVADRTVIFPLFEVANTSSPALIACVLITPVVRRSTSSPAMMLPLASKLALLTRKLPNASTMLTVTSPGVTIEISLSPPIAAAPVVSASPVMLTRLFALTAISSPATRSPALTPPSVDVMVRSLSARMRLPDMALKSLPAVRLALPARIVLAFAERPVWLTAIVLSASALKLPPTKRLPVAIAVTAMLSSESSVTVLLASMPP